MICYFIFISFPANICRGMLFLIFWFYCWIFPRVLLESDDINRANFYDFTSASSLIINYRYQVEGIILCPKTQGKAFKCPKFEVRIIHRWHHLNFQIFLSLSSPLQTYLCLKNEHKFSFFAPPPLEWSHLWLTHYKKLPFLPLPLHRCKIFELLAYKSFNFACSSNSKTIWDCYVSQLAPG